MSLDSGSNGLVSLPNPHLKTLGRDYLYHIGLTTDDNLVERFGDVKFLCMGGKNSRMRHFAEFIYEKLGHPKNCEFEEFSNSNNRRLKDIAEVAGRFSMFKVGPVISASHGIGIASMSVALHEMLKLLYYAKCRDVTVIRIGTSGGLGLNPGTVVITKQAYNGLLEPHHRQVVCGKSLTFDSKADEKLAEKIYDCAKSLDIRAEIGNSMATHDFYEEQARLDGAICNFTEKDKRDFLRKAHDEHGIRNIEMECSCWIAICNRANVKSAVVCVTLLNRLLGDGVTDDTTLTKKWEEYPQEVVASFIQKNC